MLINSTPTSIFQPSFYFQKIPVLGTVWIAVFCHKYQAKMIAQQSKQMIRQITPKEEILRIVLIGLPYSGVDDVAKILKEVYGCDIFRVELEDKPETMTIDKYFREACFQPYQKTPKAVLVGSQFYSSTLKELKKRNYVNIVQVDAPFRTRYQHYLQQKKLEDSHEAVSKFMQLDQESQDEQYFACLQYARVRLCHRGRLQDLKKEITRKEKEIIRYFRPTWDQYFMKIADIARRRSNCMKTSVGAVIVNKENRVVSTGYNGTPKGLLSCYKLGCERCNSNSGQQLDQCLCLHAEESALIEVGISKTVGCSLYTTYFPCFSCAKIIKQAGITKIYYMDEYEKKDSGKPFIEEYFDPKDVVKIPADNLYY